jgi:choline dehydrogenase-like flavoprotein
MTVNSVQNSESSQEHSIVDVQHTSCCIVGGGPAGAVLALLLARQNIPVMLLEVHKDFDREFRFYFWRYAASVCNGNYGAIGFSSTIAGIAPYKNAPTHYPSCWKYRHTRRFSLSQNQVSLHHYPAPSQVSRIHHCRSAALPQFSASNGS